MYTISAGLGIKSVNLNVNYPPLLHVLKVTLLFFGWRPVLFLAALVFCINAGAQLCTGSLGDPAVNITFGPGGSNTNNTAPSGYVFTSSSCPDDGYYTVTGSTSGCFGNSWHP